MPHMALKIIILPLAGGATVTSVASSDQMELATRDMHAVVKAPFVQVARHDIRLGAARVSQSARESSPSAPAVKRQDTSHSTKPPSVTNSTNLHSIPRNLSELSVLAVPVIRPAVQSAAKPAIEPFASTNPTLINQISMRDARSYFTRIGLDGAQAEPQAMGEFDYSQVEAFGEARYLEAADDPAQPARIVVREAKTHAPKPQNPEQQNIMSPVVTPQSTGASVENEEPPQSE